MDLTYIGLGLAAWLGIIICLLKYKYKVRMHYLNRADKTDPLNQMRVVVFRHGELAVAIRWKVWGEWESKDCRVTVMKNGTTVFEY